MNVTQKEIEEAKAEAEKLWEAFEMIQAQHAVVIAEINAARTKWHNAQERSRALATIGVSHRDRDEPVIYQRGELPSRDARDEHDKSL